jgi:hypothetical protein
MFLYAFLLLGSSYFTNHKLPFSTSMFSDVARNLVWGCSWNSWKFLAKNALLFYVVCELKAKTQLHLVHNSLGLGGGGANTPLHPPPILATLLSLSPLNVRNKEVQVSLVICGRCVPSFWTANLEFANKKSIFDWKIVILDHFCRCE